MEAKEMGKTRCNKLSIRVSPEEYKHFLALQRESGLSQADFLMRLLDDIPMPDNRVLEEYRAINEKMSELQEMIKGIKPDA